MTLRRCAHPEDTAAAGRALAAWLVPGDVVVLTGPLGAGKTVFATGVAAVLGVRERVTSPTFTLVRPHRCANDRGIATLYHADLYRVESLDEAADLALGELVEESAVALIEWGERAEALWGPEHWEVRFTTEGDDGRALALVAPPGRAPVAGWAA